MTYYPILLKPFEEGYLVRVPDVPGCVTSGSTLDEAVEMASDALCGCLCAYEDEGVQLAPPRSPAELEKEEGEFVVMIGVDTLRYRMETDTRAVRKSVSMPAWMSNLADQRGLNFSQLLQEALRERLGVGA